MPASISRRKAEARKNVCEHGEEQAPPGLTYTGIHMCAYVYIYKCNCTVYIKMPLHWYILTPEIPPAEKELSLNLDRRAGFVIGHGTMGGKHCWEEETVGAHAGPGSSV